MSFKSWRSYSIFKCTVDTKQRYILNDESKDFLNSIIETCKDRETILKTDSIAWRAQNGHSWRPYYQHNPETNEDIHVDNFPAPFPESKLRPIEDSATEGRANSKGIPCLYVATDKETPMAEIRPWLGAIISVGQFKLKKDLKILDFSIEHGNNNMPFYFEEPTVTERVKAVWSDIDNAFSKPTKASDLKSEYAPTQIISEFIKSKGYDGIAYKSSLASGHNICLFDLNSAGVVRRSIHKATNIKFDFKRIEEH